MTINPLVACQEVSLLVESISQGLVPRFIHIHFILIQEVVKRGLGRTHGLPPSPDTTARRLAGGLSVYPHWKRFKTSALHSWPGLWPSSYNNPKPIPSYVKDFFVGQQGTTGPVLGLAALSEKAVMDNGSEKFHTPPCPRFSRLIRM